MSSSNSSTRTVLAIAGVAVAATGVLSVAAGRSHSESAPAAATNVTSFAPPSVAPYTSPGSGSSSPAKGTAASGVGSVAESSGAAGSTATAAGAAGSAAAGTGKHASSGRETTAPKGSPSQVFVFNSAGQTIVNAGIMPIYVDSSGILAPPGGISGLLADRGWARPGYAGAAILAGHVTYDGMADTFFNLTKVVAGDKIIVRYDSGDQVTFVATKSAAKPKSTLSKDATVWDSGSATPVLRLITCDPSTPIKNGHFEGNWVVWASLA